MTTVTRNTTLSGGGGGGRSFWRPGFDPACVSVYIHHNNFFHAPKSISGIVARRAAAAKTFPPPPPNADSTGPASFSVHRAFSFAWAAAASTRFPA